MDDELGRSSITSPSTPMAMAKPLLLLFQKKPLLLLPLLLLLAIVAEPRYEPIDVDIHFNLRTQPIEVLLQQMRQHLIANMPRITTAGHPYLAPKDAAPGSPPGRWLKVHLVGETDNDRTTLAFSDGDLYLLAFTNAAGHWYAIPGYDTLFPGGTNLTQGITTSYTTLINGKERLTTVPLGRPAALRAAGVLSRYNRATSDEDEVKRALVTFMIVISEGLRFFPIRAVYTQDWEAERFLDSQQAKLVVKWGEISFALYTWERNPNGPRVGRLFGKLPESIRSARAALDTVDLLKRPREICIDKTKS